MVEESTVVVLTVDIDKRKEVNSHFPPFSAPAHQPLITVVAHLTTSSAWRRASRNSSSVTGSLKPGYLESHAYGRKGT